MRIIKCVEIMAEISVHDLHSPPPSHFQQKHSTLSDSASKQDININAHIAMS